MACRSASGIRAIARSLFARSRASSGAADSPQILVVEQGAEGPEVSMQPAPPEMVGARTPERMAALNSRFNNGEKQTFPAQFAVIGPAGEQWESVWCACIIGSTQEMVMSGEDKFRFGGRLGMGAVLGSKNIATGTIRMTVIVRQAGTTLAFGAPLPSNP